MNLRLGSKTSIWKQNKDLFGSKGDLKLLLGLGALAKSNTIIIDIIIMIMMI